MGALPVIVNPDTKEIHLVSVHCRAQAIVEIMLHVSKGANALYVLVKLDIRDIHQTFRVPELNVECEITNERPACSCSSGFTGDPYIKCV